MGIRMQEPGGPSERALQERVIERGIERLVRGRGQGQQGCVLFRRELPAWLRRSRPAGECTDALGFSPAPGTGRPIQQRARGPNRRRRNPCGPSVGERLGLQMPVQNIRKRPGADHGGTIGPAANFLSS